ncbi:MAG: hypothetical protein ACOX5W_06300 [Bacillota bacterium]
MVVGSSLTVSPANSLASIAKQVAIINLETTSFDRQADLVIQEKAGKVLLDLKLVLEREEKN